MLKKFLALGCLAACTVVFTGCDKASSAASKASSAASAEADKMKKEAEEKMGKMKDDVAKAIDFSAIETKINGLTGDAKTGALSKFGDLKKMFEDFKGMTDIAKMGDMKDKLMTLLAEVKKMVGM